MDGSASAMSGDWRQLCERSGIAPDTIERIARRYLAYATHHAGRANALPLSDWLKWYTIENGDQLAADQIPVRDCSVAETTTPGPTLDRGPEILRLVELRLAHPAE